MSDATLQDEFQLHTYFPCGGTQQTGLDALRKFVSELYYERLNGFFPNDWHSNLWLRIKLEEKASNKWRQCSNLRDISYDISGTAILFINQVAVHTANYHVIGNYYCSSNPDHSASGPINVLIASWIYPTYDVSSFWRVNGHGFITQHIQGDNNYITRSKGEFENFWP